MKNTNKYILKNKFKRILAVIISISIVSMGLPIEIKANAADSTSVITAYQPTITESIDSSGFKHPGVGLTKDILENMRAEIMAHNEPWYSYYNAMTSSSAAQKTIIISIQSTSDATKPSTTVYNSQTVESLFIADGLKAYTQAIMYYITGDETYRANAMRIIRLWSQMDPSKYEYYTDACIHSGIPLNRMVTAAEILRYTSYQTQSLMWTEKDIDDFTNNLINPVINTFQHDNNHFMNQHLYPLLGAMAGYIFTGNKARYEEGVEWFTVNKTAVDQGQNGAIKQLFRLVDTDVVTGEKLAESRVQHVEMGRDEAHGSGDLTNAAIIERLLLAQGTKVDPVTGEESTADNAVNPYQFLDNRILKAANYFWQYMLGYDTPWTPVAAHTDASGNPVVIYKILSDSYRGRMTTANFWDAYYYYKYSLGIDMEKEAPYFNEAFSKRLPSNYYYQGTAANAWNCVDGGGDFWLYIPKTAEAEGAQYLPKEQSNSSLVQIEDRYTKLDNNSTTKQEGDTSYIEVTATEDGSKIAPISVSYPDRTKPCVIGLRFRTNGTAKLEMSKEKNSTSYHTLTLPNTNGQWRYITYDMGVSAVSYSQMDKDYSLLYFNIVGSGTTVDIDSLNVNGSTQLTPPVFKAGDADLNLFAYAGAGIPTTYDFSATDKNTSHVISYQMDNIPEGAVLDSSTGIFSWTPTQVGTYAMVVSASDGESVSAKNVVIQVTSDRKAAVAAAIVPYDENTSYESESLDAYKTAYDDVIETIDSDNDSVFYQKLVNLRTKVEGLKLLTPLLSDGSINYPSLVTSTAGDYTASLVDDNPNSYPAYGLAPGLFHTFDFGSNFKVSSSAFELQVRMGFPERMAGTAVFGSNDGDNWTQLTDETKFTEDEQKLQVKQEYQNSQFRFIKIQMIDPQPGFDSNITSTMFEVSEFKIFGERYEVPSQLSSVKISSDQSIKNRINRGDTVKLSFISKQKLSDVKVTIQGQDATVQTTDNINWTAVATMNEDAEFGKVKFNISSKAVNGTDTEETYFTTDNSTLFIADESGLISFTGDKTTNTFSTSVSGPIDIIDPSTSYGRPSASVTFTNVSNLFDRDITTFSDFRLAGNGTGGYVTFDFKQGNQVSLGRVDILARATYGSRIVNTEIQGSNDNINWKMISDSRATATEDWQSLNISDSTPYRYIRVINTKTAWYGNMAELRLYTKALSKLEVALDKTLELGSAAQLNVNGIYNNGSTINLSATTSAAITYTSSDPSIISVDDTGKVTGNRVGIADITVNVNLDGQMLSKTANLSVNIISDNTVTSVERLPDINVVNGTDKSDIGLPDNVDITLGNSTTTSAVVAWDNGNPDYDGDIAGIYTFTGTLKLPDGVTNPDGYNESVDVIVQASQNQGTSLAVTHVDSINDINVEKGTDKDEIRLPERVDVMLSDGATTSAAVTWDDGKPNYDGDIAGTYTFTGTLEVLDGVTNPDDYKANVDVIVKKKNSTNSSSSHHHSNTSTSISTGATSPSNITKNNDKGNSNNSNKAGWVQDTNGKWYLLKDDGNKIIGWKLVDNNWYFLDNNSGVMATGWQESNGKRYLFIY